MRIDDPSAASTLAGPSPSPTAGGASRDEFLKLFVAQLENQNPLEPQDGAEFVAQLAQFSSVEQAAQTNQRLSELVAGQMSASNAALAGFVGKVGTVIADDFDLTTKGAGVPALGVELDGAIQRAEVVIRDGNGVEVRRFEVGPHEAGRAAIAWDGMGSDGQPVPPGHYQIEVSAEAADGSAVGAAAVMTGRIEAIDFVDGVPRLRMGAVSAAPSNVLSIE